MTWTTIRRPLLRGGGGLNLTALLWERRNGWITTRELLRDLPRVRSIRPRIVASVEVCAICGTTDELPDGSCAYCVRNLKAPR